MSFFALSPTRRAVSTLALAFAVSAGAIPLALAQVDPLPSWNEGATKASIIDFVTRVTLDGGTDFISPPERVAVFDNDGTLWSEQPVYFQFAFALDRIRALAEADLTLGQKEPYKAVLSADAAAIAALGEKGIAQILALTHAGMTIDDFSAAVGDWLKTARHPRFNRPYTDLVFQPMLELLAYLRAKGFKTFIVSGGGIEFMRAWVPDSYGIPPEQIVGSSVKTAFKLNGDIAVIEKLPEIEFIDDGPGKPVGINRFIGRRPILAFGNSDGDHQMLQWTAGGSRPRLMALLHHTDEQREWAYDRKSHVGRLDKALDEANAKGWLVVDMKRDWKRIFPFE